MNTDKFFQKRAERILTSEEPELAELVEQMIAAGEIPASIRNLVGRETGREDLAQLAFHYAESMYGVAQTVRQIYADKESV